MLVLLAWGFRNMWVGLAASPQVQYDFTDTLAMLSAWVFVWAIALALWAFLFGRDWHRWAIVPSLVFVVGGPTLGLVVWCFWCSLSLLPELLLI